MLLEAARGYRLETLYVLAVSAGLRQGELLGLRWADVDLGRGTLQVRQQLTRTRAGLSFTSPKGDKSRSVRLTLPRRLPFRIVRTLRRSSTLCGPCFRDLPSAGSSSAVS